MTSSMPNKTKNGAGGLCLCRLKRRLQQRDWRSDASRWLQSQQHGCWMESAARRYTDSLWKFVGDPKNFILDYLRIQERYLKHPLTITLDVRPAQENTIISVLQVVLKPALCCVACRRICSYSLTSTIFRSLSLRRGCKLRAIWSWTYTVAGRSLKVWRTFLQSSWRTYKPRWKTG